MATYLKLAADFNSALTTLATTFPGRCTVDTCPNTTAGGRQTKFVRITNPAVTTAKTPVLIMAGIHAREWAPPDALLDFAKDLLTLGTSGDPSYTSRDIVYPVFHRTDLTPPVRFRRLTVHRSIITAILNKLDLYILPLVNPDGREFSFTPPINVNQWQRKNLRDNGLTTPCFLEPPSPGRPGIPLDLSKGVDLNRNFGMAFDVDQYYDPGFLAGGDVSVSKTPCGGSRPVDGETYEGPSAFSEPETNNVKSLMDGKNIRFFVDIHSWGRTVMWGWAAANTQKQDPSSNYQNTTLHTHRDNLYGEFLPPEAFNRSHAVAGRMREFIRKMATGDSRRTSNKALRSGYRLDPDKQHPVAPGVFKVGLYPTPGSTTDHVTVKQVSTVSGPPFEETPVSPDRYAFGIEAGSHEETDFWPDFDHEFPKIKREIHMSLWGLLSYVVRPSAGVDWPITPGP
jgi:hypothetical protein